MLQVIIEILALIIFEFARAVLEPKFGSLVERATSDARHAIDAQDAAPFFTAKSRGDVEVRLGVEGGVVFRVPWEVLWGVKLRGGLPVSTGIGHRRRGLFFSGHFFWFSFCDMKNPKGRTHTRSGFFRACLGPSPF